MKQADRLKRFREISQAPLPLPGNGSTSLRHMRLMEIGREDLSLARLGEAHWDAVAILAEAGREARPGSLYGVWASEVPHQPMSVAFRGELLILNGTKRFCGGAGVIDRALVTAGSGMLLDVDLKGRRGGIDYDYSMWKTNAFAETRTAMVTFTDFEVRQAEIIGVDEWYSTRAGFWHGACGPASCWVGGAAGLLDWVLGQRRDDPHTVAHVGAMYASVWAMRSLLDAAGREIDSDPLDAATARVRALAVRHVIEQNCSDILRRLPRAYGPHPLAMDEEVAQRFAELELYLCQSHAERDLEVLGRAVRERDMR